MHAKYYKNGHPIAIQFRLQSYTIWKRLIEPREQVEPHIHWIVGKGNIDAFYDEWCVDGYK